MSRASNFEQQNFAKNFKRAMKLIARNQFEQLLENFPIALGRDTAHFFNEVAFQILGHAIEKLERSAGVLVVRPGSRPDTEGSGAARTHDFAPAVSALRARL